MLGAVFSQHGITLQLKIFTYVKTNSLSAALLALRIHFRCKSQGKENTALNVTHEYAKQCLIALSVTCWSAQISGGLRIKDLILLNGFLSGTTLLDSPSQFNSLVQVRLFLLFSRYLHILIWRKPNLSYGGSYKMAPRSNSRLRPSSWKHMPCNVRSAQEQALLLQTHKDSQRQLWIYN